MVETHLQMVGTIPLKADAGCIKTLVFLDLAGPTFPFWRVQFQYHGGSFDTEIK